MALFFIDFLIVASLIIGITAVNGVLTNGIAEKLFGGKRHADIYQRSKKIQTNWNQVGGNTEKTS